MATHYSILAWRIPMDRGALAGYGPWWGRKESDSNEQLIMQHSIGYGLWDRRSNYSLDAICLLASDVYTLSLLT